jgi:hypothetical protein
MSAPDRRATEVLEQMARLLKSQSTEERRNWIKCYDLQFQQLFLEHSCSYLI